MTSEIPPDFDKPWDLSDIVIHTNNSDGKDIHAYKGALVMFSPYFRSLFFGEFKEKNNASVNVNCDYDVMVEILKNIHQIGYQYNGTQKPYSSKMLVKMYQAADFYDFAFIRKMCLDHIESNPSVDMVEAASELKLYDLRVKIVMKLNKKQVEELLNLSKFEFYFTKEEFLLLFEKSVGKPLPTSNNNSDEKPMEPLDLEDTTQELENPRVDLTKPFPTADLIITTNDRSRRVLYSNKSVVEMMCPKVHEFLFTRDELQLEGPGKFMAYIDEEYTTMKEILSIIHMCDIDYRKERTFHPALLHAMYSAADETRLDIPLIRNFCVAKLTEIKNIDALDVVWRLNLITAMCEVLNSLSTSQLRDWVYRDDDHLSYRKKIGVCAVTPSQKERVFYANSVVAESTTRWLITKFKPEFFPGM